MPEHILVQIFNSLDLASKKSFSETCVSFNRIYSNPQHLSKLWLNISSIRVAKTVLSNTYANLKWNCNMRNKKSSGKFWRRMAPTTKSLKVGDNWMGSQSFIAGLPHLCNLTILDLDLEDYGYSLYEKEFDEMPKPEKLVSMQHLQFLRINTWLYGKFEGRYINFTTKKLHTLILFQHWQGAVTQIEETKKIRSLLEQQTHLKSVWFDIDQHDEEFGSLFDRPLVIQSQLDRFTLQDELILNDLQRENLRNFIKSQRELIALGSIFDVVNWANGPNLKLAELAIVMSWNERREEKEMLNSIVKDFPNLNAIDVAFSIYGFDNSRPLEIPDHISSLLNKLKNLTTLCVEITKIRCLKAIAIGLLKSFEFTLAALNFSADYVDVLEFLHRHNKVTKVVGHFRFNDGDRDRETNIVLKMVERICDDSKNIKSLEFTIDRENFLTAEPVQELICELIWKYAIPGFSFLCATFEVMIRYDGKFVRKVGGRWLKVKM